MTNLRDFFIVSVYILSSSPLSLYSSGLNALEMELDRFLMNSLTDPIGLVLAVGGRIGRKADMITAEMIVIIVMVVKANILFCRSLDRNNNDDDDDADVLIDLCFCKENFESDFQNVCRTPYHILNRCASVGTNTEINSSRFHLRKYDFINCRVSFLLVGISINQSTQVI